MTFWQMVIAFIVVYLCVYALISRICQCIEHCATARAYSKFRENGVLVKMDDVEAGIKKSNKEKQDVAERKFNIGDRSMCVETGVVGKCIKFYIPTACEEQTMVLTDDGRRYHAPTRLWEVADKVNPIGYEGEENTENKLLNPFGEYVVAFAANHNLPISKAYEQLMVKARLAFFQETGY